MNRTRFPHWVIPVQKLIWKPVVRSWCALPYPGHPKGCPNYGKRCRIEDPVWITDLLDIHRPIWMVHSEFNLKKHIERMRGFHPEWTDRQCRCVLYWQRRSKNQMKVRAILLAHWVRASSIVSLPEYYGVNVYATAKLSGLNLEKIKDITVCKHITLVGYKS